jgi:hypothetical protein
MDSSQEINLLCYCSCVKGKGYVPSGSTAWHARQILLQGSFQSPKVANVICLKAFVASNSFRV